MKCFDPNEYVHAVAVSEEDRQFLKTRVAEALRDYPGATQLLNAIAEAIGVPVEPATGADGDGWKHIKVDLPIVDACNLACRACSHFSPLVRKVEPRDVADIAAALTLLQNVAPGLTYSVFIMGGEPLLHPQVADIVDVVADCMPNAERFLVTNLMGWAKHRDVLVPRLLSSNTFLAYTKYGKLNAGQVAQIEAESKTSGLWISRFGNDAETFCTYPKSITDKYGRSGKAKCPMAKCPSLIGNRLYLCSPVASLEYPNESFNLSLKCSKFDYIDLRNVEHPHEILALMYLPNPFCSHCNVGANEQFPWVSGKRARDEWFED